jgi:hypothetical protein
MRAICGIGMMRQTEVLSPHLLGSVMIVSTLLLPSTPPLTLTSRLASPFMLDGRRVGGRVNETQEELMPPPPSPPPPIAVPWMPIRVLVALLLLRSLFEGPQTEYYVYSSSSVTVTELREDGTPRTETKRSSSMRTNVPGLVTPSADVEERGEVFPPLDWPPGFR